MTYEEAKNNDGTIDKKFNKSVFLFIWDRPNGLGELELSTPAIDAPSKIKEYFLWSLYPFALLADLPVVIVLIPYAIVYKATVIVLGVDGLE